MHPALGARWLRMQIFGNAISVPSRCSGDERSCFEFEAGESHDVTGEGLRTLERNMQGLVNSEAEN